MTLVVDASVVAAALIEPGEAGAWAEDVLRQGDLVAPHLMPVEVASVLRRAVSAGGTPANIASQGHQDLLRLPVELFGYQAFAIRVWQLRHSVRPYDAWYVAIAEATQAPLATLDSRLASATGPQCEFLQPSAA